MTGRVSVSARCGVSCSAKREAAMDLGGNRPWDAIIAVMVLGYGVGWFTGTPGPVPPPQQWKLNHGQMVCSSAS